MIAIFQEQMNLVYSLDGFVKRVSPQISQIGLAHWTTSPEARDAVDFQDNEEEARRSQQELQSDFV